MHYLKFKFKFFSADDPKGDSSGKMSIDDIATFLDSDSGEEDGEEELELKDVKGDKSTKQTEKESDKDKETEKVEGEGDSADNEEPDELDELEEELKKETEDEDELELITPVKRKAILAKYPTIFKDFPYLEKAYYREQKYSEIFPSIDDAKTAQEDSAVLKDFEQKILSGDLSSIISELRKEDEQSYHRLIDNYLPSLQKVDERAFFHIVNSVVKPIIYSMVQKGTDAKNEELVTAARVLNEFFYGTTRWEPHQPLIKEKDANISQEEERLKAKEQQMFAERFTEARDRLTGKVETAFKKTIEKHIDPKEDMSDYVKKIAVRDAYETLSGLMSKNTRFRGILDKAWKFAGEQNFSEESMDKIRRIINAQAQTVLPSVIKKARIEALRGIGKRVRVAKDDDETDDTDNESGRSATSKNRGPLKSPTGKAGSSNNKATIPAGMSNKDFIMSD